MIRIGMVGGGEGAFIGEVHRIALAMDGHFRLVAGCFSRDLDNTRRTGSRLGLEPERLYATAEEMAEMEAARPEAERIQAVAIVTPNHLHHAQARLFLEHGFHVVCDKPLAVSPEEADDLVGRVRESGRVFLLTHNYTGYPMVREARERVRRGEFGTLRKIHVEYLQGWLSEAMEATGLKQAEWRTDPARSGPVGALGDIGTHAFHLLEHVTGARVHRLLAQLRTHVPGRRLDDDATVLFETEDGASGTLLASQVCFGRENGLVLRLYGESGALVWRQEEPNDLHVTNANGVTHRVRTATPTTSPASRHLTRTPPGHPEGYLEAFANLYRAFAARIHGQEDAIDEPFPTVEEGARGLHFIAAALKSRDEGGWVGL